MCVYFDNIGTKNRCIFFYLLSLISLLVANMARKQGAQAAQFCCLKLLGIMS